MSHPAALLPITVYLNAQHTSSIIVHVSASSQHPIIDLKRAIATQKKIHPSVQRLTLVGGVDGFTVPTAVELTVRTRTPTLTITIETMQDKMASPYPERVKKEVEMVEKDKNMIVRLGAASPSIPPSALIPNIKKGPLPANFELDPKDTILDLKFLLADVISIAPEHQRLYIRRRGERSLIHDNATIASAGLVNGEVLKVQFEYPSNQPHHGAVHRTAIKLTEFDHPQIPDLGTNFRVASVKYANRKFLGVRSFSSDLKTRGPYVWQTYNDIATRVSNFGAGMRHLGLTKGDTIGIMSQNRTEWIIADLVCSVQSFVSVPLYDTLGHDAAKYIINHASVKAVVVSVAQLKDIVAIRSQCPTLSHLIVMDDTPLDKHNLKSVTGYTHKFSEVESVGSKYVATYPDVLPGYNDLSTICYTSGTTGNPKGVLLTHGNLIATIAAFNERLRQEPQLETETVLSYLPLAHIYERIVDSTLISEGYAIGFFQGDTLKLAEDVAELKPTVFPGVPRVWQRIYDKIHAQIEESNIIRRTLFDKAYQSRLDALRNGDTSPSLWDKIVFKKVAERFGGNIRMLSSGAAPLPAKVAEFMRIAFMCHFLEGYGLTETCAAATSMSVDDTQYGHVGAVQGSVEIKLVSVPDMEYLVTDKPNPRGEIWIRGPSIFKGYYKQPEATKECMTEDGWFMSGDVGTWLPNGNLKIIDRKKNIFKLSQGEYIKPEHIENILKQSKLVANIYVHGDSQQNFLVGVVVPDFETLKPLAAAAGSKAKTPAELVADPKVEKLIMSDLNRISAEAKLQKFEYVKRIHISKDDFTVDNGLLTPTFKLKRFVCAKHYARELSDLYAKGLPAEEKIQSKL